MDDKTVKFSGDDQEPKTCGQILEHVFNALVEKGYNPKNQLVGYLISGEPTYITSYKNSRNLIMRVDRDDIIREFVKYYIDRFEED